MKTIKVKKLSDIPDKFTGKIEYEDGDIEYLLNGKQHNINGPATIYKNGHIEYCINDELICDSLDKDYEQIFYNSKEYKIAKQQKDLLKNLLKIKNLK